MLVDGICGSGSACEGSAMLCYRCCLFGGRCQIGWLTLLISWWTCIRVGIIPLFRRAEQSPDGRQACLPRRDEQELVRGRTFRIAGT